MSTSIFLLLLAASVFQVSLAKAVYYNWHITWVNAAPDGYERPVIGINGQWPCPKIEVDKGDHLVIDVYNDLGNQSTGLHWHGLHMYMEGYMDGATGTTQCPIPPGQHMRYEVDVNQAGTYWYHSHDMGQYPDGLRGPIVVHDPATPFTYDEEYTITLSDWYHRQMVDLLNQYQSQENEVTNKGLEPLPDAALINDASNVTFKVEPGKTYLFRIIDIGNWPGFGFAFIGHNMTVVEVDGIWTDPYEVPSDQFLRVASGQRTSVLVHTHEDTSQNFAFWTTMDVNMMFVYENRPKPPGFNENATAWLVYDETKPLPPAPVFQPEELIFVEDLLFVPADHEPLLEPVNHQIVINFDSASINGIPRWVINNVTYLTPEVPSLYTALTVGDEYMFNQEVYGQVNPYVINYGDVVEIIVNDYHHNLHPWHLHGHQFQALQRTVPEGGYFNGYWANISSTPAKRDTLMVQNHGHFVIRFRATNPDMSPLSFFDRVLIILTVLSGVTRLAIPLPYRIPRRIRHDDYHHRSSRSPAPDESPVRPCQRLQQLPLAKQGQRRGE